MIFIEVCNKIIFILPELEIMTWGAANFTFIICFFTKNILCNNWNKLFFFSQIFYNIAKTINIAIFIKLFIKNLWFTGIFVEWSLSMHQKSEWKTKSK